MGEIDGEYRLATFRHQILAPRARALNSASADVFASALEAVRSELTVGFRQRTKLPAGDRAAFLREVEVSVTAISIVQASDEIRWFTQGQAIGYYPSRENWQPWHGFEEAADPLLNPARLQSAFHTSPKYLSFSLHRDPSAYATELASARDETTPSFLECARMLLFAPDEEWRVRVSRLAALAKWIREDPDLALPRPSVDEIAWALSGYDDYQEASARIRNSLRWMPLTVSALARGDSRAEALRTSRKFRERSDELEGARRAIAAAAVVLTDDPSDAATTRLSSAVLSAAGREVRDLSWPYVDPESEATAMTLGLPRWPWSIT